MASGEKIPEVVVLGAAALDWVAEVQDLPQPDGIAYAYRYTPMPGGTGGNVAEGIARLGHGVRFLGVLGDDEAGMRLLDAFADAGVDTSAIQIRKGERSASTFIAIDRNGERIIFSLGGSALYENAGELHPEWLRNVRVLFIADAFLEPALAAIEALDNESKVVFNPGGLMVSGGIESLRPILARSDALIASRLEAQALTGISDPEEAALRLAVDVPGVVILTMGKQGAVFVERGTLHKVPGVLVDEVVDTTGAGDAFSSGVVSGILKGCAWTEAIRFGCGAAALKIAHFGARGGLPTSEQVDTILKNHNRLECSEVER